MPSKAGAAVTRDARRLRPSFSPLDDDGYLAIDETTVPPGQEALARRGAQACPERAIEIVAD